MTPGVEIRPVRSDDAVALAVLFEACFGTAVPASYFHWKYEQNPCGPVVGFVADAGERLAAFYGVIPEPWEVGGERRTVHQSMDTMTHPDFRRQGLFVRLATATFDALAPGSLLVGIPGATSLPGFVGPLGWSLVDEYPLLLGPALPRRLRRRSRELAAERVDGPSAEVSALLAATRSERSARPLLDGGFFDWRVHGQSPKDHRVALVRDAGVVVYTPTSTRTTLISLVASAPDVPAARWVPEALRFVAAQTRAPLLYTWGATGAVLPGFRANRLGVGPLRDRRPLITLVTGDQEDARWSDPASFDLQPLMQD